MKTIFIFLALIFHIVHGYPRPSSELNRLVQPPIASTKGKTMMSSIPLAEKALMAQKFRSLCSFKPIEEAGNGWTTGLKRSIMEKIEKPADSEGEKFAKNFLVESIVDSVVLECGKQKHLSKVTKQDNDDIYSGLESILKNVFSGNIFGIIQSSVGIRTPEGVSSMVSEVMRTLLGNITNAQNAINAGTANSGNAVNAVSGGNVGSATG